MMRLALIFFGLGFGILLQPTAQAQCYRGHCGYSYSYATPSYSYPYTDQSLHVTYHLYPAAPAIAGNTVYGATPPGGLSQFDASEVYKLKIAAGQRYGDVGAQIIQSADTVIQQTLQANDGELQLRKLESLERILKADRVQQTTTLRTQVGGKEGRGGKEGAEPTTSSSSLPPLLPNLQAIVIAKCVSCHGGAKTEKGLDLRNLGALDERYEALILRKIMSDDPAARMPPPGNPPLTFEEKIAFVAGSEEGSRSQAQGPTLNLGPSTLNPLPPAKQPAPVVPRK